MSRRIFTPFDPDAIGASFVKTTEAKGAVFVHPAPEGETMLSEVIDQQDWHLIPGQEGQEDQKGQGPGTSKPLDNHAKWKLSELAERAYTLLKSRGLLAGETLEGYRRRIAIAACGKRISQASLGDRFVIQSAFLREMERAKEAAEAALKAQGTARDIALFKLAEACRLKRYPENYGAGIAWRRYKKPLHELTAKQIWWVVYNVNNNANQRDGKGRPDNRWKKLKRQRAAQQATQHRRPSL